MSGMLQRMSTLGMTVASNVKALRSARAWSQKDLAERLTQIGGSWNRQTLGMLESRGVRAERLGDLYMLCAAFGVPLSRLLEGDAKVEVVPAHHVKLADVHETLAAARPDPAPVPTNSPGSLRADDPEEVRRLAQRLDMSIEELRSRTREVTDGVEDSPSVVRDFLAGIDASTPRQTARAKRGHATRGLQHYILNSAAFDEAMIQSLRGWREEGSSHGND